MPGSALKFHFARGGNGYAREQRNYSTTESSERSNTDSRIEEPRMADHPVVKKKGCFWRFCSKISSCFGRCWGKFRTCCIDQDDGQCVAVKKITSCFNRCCRRREGFDDLSGLRSYPVPVDWLPEDGPPRTPPSIDYVISDSDSDDSVV